MPDLSQAVPAKDLKQWHSPSSRNDAIDTLIHGVDRYNPGNLPMMEDYLREQMEQGEQDLLANLAILKLYQFNPQLSNPEIIINILTQALSSTVHGPDFNLCLSLLREPLAILADTDGDEGDGGLETVMPWLQNLHNLTRSCQFTSFWKEFNSSSEPAQLFKEQYAPRHPHLIPTFRHLFATSIASCFRKVNLTHIQEWLDLPQSEVGEIGRASCRERVSR